MTSHVLKTPSKAEDILNDFNNFRQDLKKNYTPSHSKNNRSFGQDLKVSTFNDQNMENSNKFSF
jgi:hypothetical protein